MDPIVAAMVHEIEVNYQGRFYMHSLPEIAIAAMHKVNGVDPSISKMEVKRACDLTLAYLREAYPYTDVRLEK